MSYLAVTQPSSHLHHSYWPFSKPLQLSLCAPLMPFFSPPHLSLLSPSYCPSPSVQLLFHSLLALQLDTSAVPPCVDPLQPSAWRRLLRARLLDILRPPFLQLSVLLVLALQ